LQGSLGSDGKKRNGILTGEKKCTETRARKVSEGKEKEKFRKKAAKRALKVLPRNGRKASGKKKAT